MISTVVLFSFLADSIVRADVSVNAKDNSNVTIGSVFLEGAKKCDIYVLRLIILRLQTQI